MVDLIVEQNFAGTRDGLTQLQRRWRPVDSDAPARSAVLLVHGIGEHSGRYDHVGRFLAEHGHDVMAFDARGHGQSGGRRGYVETFEEFLDDVEDLVVERRQLGLPVVLFGHSLGGLVSTSYVVRGRPAPDLLVLSAPALRAVVPRWQTVMAPVLAKTVPKFFVKSDFDPAILADDVTVQEDYVTDPLRVGGATARLGDQIFRAMASTSAALEQISMPTYVLHGSADELVPAEVSRPLADLDSVTYRSWPGLRHECLNEPSHLEVLKEIEVWLTGQLQARADPGPPSDR